MKQSTLYEKFDPRSNFEGPECYPQYEAKCKNLLCPSDTLRIRQFSPADWQAVTGCATPPAYGIAVQPTSYGANDGVFYWTNDGLKHDLYVTQGFGPILRFADVTDRLSNTVLFTENAAGIRWKYDESLVWYWLNGYDIFGGVSINVHGDENANLRSFSIYGAVSYHTSNANFCFAEGSVHFLQKNIDSWQLSETELFDAINGQQMPTKGYKLYQRLFTRNGGEATEGLP